MRLKKLLAYLIISTTIIPVIPTALATDNLSSVSITSNVNTVKNAKTEDNILDTDEMNKQLDDIYNKVGTALNIEPQYVKILHLIAGGKAIFADKKPNIYADETINSMKGPFEIEGANTQYKVFNQVECADQNIERPSKYYIPDTAYSVTYDIVQLMNSRLQYSRGGMQTYFDALNNSTKKNIIFCEAVMQYTGENEEVVNNFYKVYEKILFDKQKDENILEFDSNNAVVFKQEYLDIFINNNITNERTLKYLAIILSFDKNLAKNDNSEALRNEFVTPYVKNYTSRENLMIASMCLIGKARYVWGGGHSGTSNIDGINPSWILFEQLYNDTPTIVELNENNEVISETRSESFNRCIKPKSSWCPIHLATEDGSCAFTGEVVHSVDEYVDIMSKYIDTSEMDKEKYRELMKNVDFSNGLNIDLLNGLDCSGYVSWLYNQVSSKGYFESVASEFFAHEGFKEIETGNVLMPGDSFAWSAHIVEIIGKVSDSGKVYITTEATPNIVKFGVIYYSGARQSEIELAKQIATEANQLLGNTNEYEPPHAYCIDTVAIKDIYYDEEGNIIEDIENYEGTYTSETTNDYTLVRLNEQFIDEDIIIDLYDKKLIDMNAQEIIQYTIRKLPQSYVSGYDSYCGELFDKEQVGVDL